MMQLLLITILGWINPEKIKLDNYRDDGPIGFFLEVDFYYPDKLHDLYDDYLLASEKVKVKK